MNGLTKRTRVSRSIVRDKRKLNGFREGTKEKRDARGIPAKLLSRNTRQVFFVTPIYDSSKLRAPSAVAHAPWSTQWRCRRAPGGTRAGPRGTSSEQTRRWCVSTRARRSLRARSVPSRGPQQAFSRLARATPRDPARPRPPPLFPREERAGSPRDTPIRSRPPPIAPDRPRPRPPGETPRLSRRAALTVPTIFPGRFRAAGDARAVARVHRRTDALVGDPRRRRGRRVRRAGHRGRRARLHEFHRVRSRVRS